MTKIEKSLCNSFFNIPVPQEFLNTPEKTLINEFFKGQCKSIIDHEFIDCQTFEKMNKLKIDLTNEIDFNNIDNVIYFDLLRLFLAITKKYIK